MCAIVMPWCCSGQRLAAVGMLARGRAGAHASWPLPRRVLLHFAVLVCSLGDQHVGWLPMAVNRCFRPWPARRQEMSLASPGICLLRHDWHPAVYNRIIVCSGSGAAVPLLQQVCSKGSNHSLLQFVWPVLFMDIVLFAGCMLFSVFPRGRLGFRVRLQQHVDAHLLFLVMRVVYLSMRGAICLVWWRRAVTLAWHGVWCCHTRWSWTSARALVRRSVMWRLLPCSCSLFGAPVWLAV